MFVVCLLETKIDVLSVTWANELMGTAFDYCCVPAQGASGGIVVAWRREVWNSSQHVCRRFSASVCLSRTDASPTPWWLTAVYGPVEDRNKPLFLQELRDVRVECEGSWLLCGDLNMIYQAADKNNNRLNLRAMRRFRRTLDELHVQELHLHGRLFTWSNERTKPTLERIDRAFASVEWFERFSNHRLKTLSSNCSDHAPLLLQLRDVHGGKPHFRFEAFWVKLQGFEDVVREAWVCPFSGIDCCRILDCKLRNTAKALKSWSMRQVGSVRLQLMMSREIVAQLDAAQDLRALSDGEQALRRELKMLSLGLSSMARTISRQRSRIRFLEEGDANTKFFHLQACHRNRKAFIPSLQHDGQVFSDEEAKADHIFAYYNGILGTQFNRLHGIVLDELLPQLDLQSLDSCFSEAEIWETIKELPGDRAPGPDGFTGLFYKVAWPIYQSRHCQCIQCPLVAGRQKLPPFE